MVIFDGHLVVNKKQSCSYGGGTFFMRIHARNGIQDSGLASAM